MGIKTVLENRNSDIRVTGEAETGDELFQLEALSTADIVLLDINLPDIWGVEVARRLHKEYPALKILAVSGENSAETVKSMLDAGINGFLSKRRSDLDEVADAIRTVMSGLEYFGRDISAIIYDIYVAKKKTTAVTSEFTEREKDIILACRDGLLCKEIAARLGISTHTVNAHKNNIFAKLGINNTMEMVQYALKKGIITIDN